MKQPTRASVQRKISELQRTSEDQFLAKYSNGYGARSWFLVDQNARYPAKAIWAASHTPPRDTHFNTSESIAGLKKLGYELLHIPTGKGRRRTTTHPSLPPEGNPEPDKRTYTTNGFLRDSKVRAFVRRHAGGICEFCGMTSFQTSAGEPFVETHHIDPVSKGGKDVVSNVIALCPNHHREAHHGRNRAKLRRAFLKITSSRVWSA